MDKKDVKSFLGEKVESQEKKKYNLLLKEKNTEAARKILKNHGKTLPEYVDFCIEDLIKNYK